MKSFTLVEILIVVGILALLVGLSVPALRLFQGGSSSSQPATSSPADDNRIKDSRHTHFDYSRFIATSTEKITLIFSNPPGPDTNQDIIIADNLQDGQIIWEGQNIKIQTHRLNDLILYTQFSVHRDRRDNNKSLRITIDGDASGDLIRYQSDGQTAKGNSIYVAEPNLQ